MSIVIFLVLFVLSLGVAAFAVKRGVNPKKAIIVQVASVVMILGACFMFSSEVQAAGNTSTSQSQAAKSDNNEKTSTAQGIGYIGMAIAIGCGCIGSGLAVASAAPAAIGAMAEDPKTFGKSIVFVGLAEGVAVFGVLIAFLIMVKLA